MQLKHVQSLTQPSESINKVTALCWAPNGSKLAVCTIDRVISLFDSEGVRRDKFSTKPAEKGPKNYIVREMVFSPQSDKLAVAQSDNMVFVYKIGSEWGDKKSICNKFQQTSSITCITWPSKRLNEVVYGLAEGKVKVGQMKTYKPSTLYETDSYVTAICSNPAGNSVVSAHVDGSIYTFAFDSIERGGNCIAKFSCVPFALSWGLSIVVAGNDGQVRFYDEDGGEEHSFDNSKDPACREFTTATTNPTGDTIVLGNFDSLYVYSRNKDTLMWESKGTTKVENMYSVTALSWKSDGSTLAVGTLCGVVDFYDICIKRTLFKGGFEVTYVSHSQAIVRHIETNMKIVIRSQYGDLETLKISEIQWQGNGKEKFIFENENACIIHSNGEVLVVEYGINEILGSVRTSYTSSHLLNFCTYVQWVPRSDVVVAQNHSNLCVWYNVLATNQVTIYPIKGDIEEIERNSNKTEVIVDEGITQAVYPLNESLIEFSTATDDNNYFKAIDILDNLELSIEVEGMWKQLLNKSLNDNNLLIAYRCATAIGDNKTNECIEMYQRYHKHLQAINIAELMKHPKLHEMKENYFNYLISSNQEEEAAKLKIHEGDYNQAINLFLKGGMPGKAAMVILDNPNIHPPVSIQLLDTVATNLVKAGYYDLAGEFYETKLDELNRALDCYLKGHVYRKAIDLARKHYPSKVVELQDQWGDYLVTQKQIDMAINHYIEAKEYQKAIEAAINSRHYARALQLVDIMDSEVAKPYYRQLARYYEDTNQIDIAEKCYLSADQPNYAVEMHTRLGHWEVAHKLAMSYMSEGEVGLLYINQAQKLESAGKLREAERLYLTVKEKDLAINMYKKHRHFDDMIRLVKDYRPDLIKETHQFLAQHLEMEGSLKDAENHYVEANEWQSAVNMYRTNELWDDAIRVSKMYGGLAASKRVTIALVMAIGTKEGLKYLTKHGLVEAAIDHATENGAYDIAFELAALALPKKVIDIHLKYALFLEDAYRFKEAEEEFIQANKPREAIEMYIHQKDYKNALRVAEAYDATAISDIYIAQAKAKIEINDFQSAEELFLQSGHPELALDTYMSTNQWNDALRIAQQHLPHRVVEVNNHFQSTQSRSNAVNNKGIEISKKLIEIHYEEQAADVLFDVGRQDEAITVCLTHGKYEKAKALSQGNPALRSRVDEAYQSFITSKGDAKGLVDIGKADVALDVLAKRGDWEKLWEVAAKERLSSVTIGKYVILRIEELLKGTISQVDEAVRTLQKRSGPVSPSALVTYKRLVNIVLSRSLDKENNNYLPTVSSLKETLFRLTNQFKAQEKHTKSLNLLDIAAKCSITLLKYPFVIPQDKAFYLAGAAVRAVGNTNLAFMLLNRYVDITEAMDTNDTSFLDNSEYNIIDGVPLNGPLPQSHYISDEDIREEERTWVLSIVTDSTIEQKFPRREQTRNTLYEGLYHSDRPACIVTGYPIHPADLLDINNSVANRKDWNTLVSKIKIDPWTGQAQNPIY
eukprot:gene19403-25277_t